MENERFYSADKRTFVTVNHEWAAEVVDAESDEVIDTIAIFHPEVLLAISNHREYMAALYRSLLTHDLYIYKKDDKRAPWHQRLIERVEGPTPSSIQFRESEYERFPPYEIILATVEDTERIFPPRAPARPHFRGRRRP